MELLQAMQARHSVRAYTDKKIEGETLWALIRCLDECNAAGRLHLQLVRDEPKAFAGFPAHYGRFTGVHSYIAVAGKKGPDFEERCGYYGEKAVLRAQQLGLNTCWVALTYSRVKGAFTLAPDEKLCCLIAIGYGSTQGVPHRSKPVEQLYHADGPLPDWFRKGMAAALLAPTALNQQKFLFTLNDSTVTAAAGRGFYTRLDLGIAKYHFALGAGEQHFTWG